MFNNSSRPTTNFSLPVNDEVRTLLLVDDDVVSCSRIARGLEQKGFEVRTARTIREGIEIARTEQPLYAVIELRLPDGCGLDVVTELRKWRNDSRIIMLTAYGNIATAVAAIKAGAVDYLAKPASVENIEMSLTAEGVALPPPPEDPMSADRVRWEHIQRIFYQNDCNVSETARRLHMHRRTLQRILSKHAPRDDRATVSAVATAPTALRGAA